MSIIIRVNSLNFVVFIVEVVDDCWSYPGSLAAPAVDPLTSYHSKLGACGPTRKKKKNQQILNSADTKKWRLHH
jgi:hypothetical protein